MVRHSEKYSAEVFKMRYPPSIAIYESRDTSWLHSFCYFIKSGANLDIKVGKVWF